MPRITKVYTRTGDDGTTGLGGGQRVAKESLRVSAYGSVDELGAQIGVVLASGVADNLVAPLRSIQNTLFHLGSDLCILEEDKQRFAVPRIEARHIDALESLMDDFSADLPPLANFILAGGHPAAAHLHVARCVCRRAERETVALAREEDIGEHVVPYLNRLSDTLFVLARVQNQRTGHDDPLWDSRA
ncbi:MAG: cob(I)yrinic acid a,c-diamide adenosyltransferase [Acidobacteriota bacterium]